MVEAIAQRPQEKFRQIGRKQRPRNVAVTSILYIASAQRQGRPPDRPQAQRRSNEEWVSTRRNTSGSTAQSRQPNYGPRRRSSPKDRTRRSGASTDRALTRRRGRTPTACSS